MDGIRWRGTWGISKIKDLGQSIGGCRQSRRQECRDSSSVAVGEVRCRHDAPRCATPATRQNGSSYS